MISYAPLWVTLKNQGMSTYTLRQYKGFGGGTIQRLRQNLSVSTNTLDDLCKILKCPLSDVAIFIEDTEELEIKK